MHTAKIHRRKKGASDLEAYQIVIVGNRRLIYHGSTLLLPSPIRRPLSPLLSSLVFPLFPSYYTLIIRDSYEDEYTRGNERTFHLTFHEDRNNRGAGVRYFRTIFVVVVVSLLSFFFFFFFPSPYFYFVVYFYIATRISLDLSSSKIAWKHELRTSTRLDATLFAFSYRK